MARKPRFATSITSGFETNSGGLPRREAATRLQEVAIAVCRHRQGATTVLESWKVVQKRQDAHARMA